MLSVIAVSDLLHLLPETFGIREHRDHVPLPREIEIVDLFFEVNKGKCEKTISR